MTFALSTPVTGAAQTGLLSPTYTVAADKAPDESNGKQYAVTGLGGTQTGVNVHSIAIPFTLTYFRPKQLKTLGKPNPITGLISNVPRNESKFITRKGVLPLAGQPYQNMVITTTISVPAGADAADPANIRAALSAHFGSIAQATSGIGDTVINNVI